MGFYLFWKARQGAHQPAMESEWQPRRGTQSGDSARIANFASIPATRTWTITGMFAFPCQLLTFAS